MLIEVTLGPGRMILENMRSYGQISESEKRLGSESQSQPGCSEQFQHAFEVVGHDSDADFGAGP